MRKVHRQRAGGWLEWSVCAEKTLAAQSQQPEETVATDKEKFATSAREIQESVTLVGEKYNPTG